MQINFARLIKIYSDLKKHFFFFLKIYFRCCFFLYYKQYMNAQSINIYTMPANIAIGYFEKKNYLFFSS